MKAGDSASCVFTSQENRSRAQPSLSLLGARLTVAGEQVPGGHALWPLAPPTEQGQEAGQLPVPPLKGLCNPPFKTTGHTWNLTLLFLNIYIYVCVYLYIYMLLFFF